MVNIVDRILIPLVISFFCSALFVFPTIWLANHFNLVDDPQKHKHPAIIHKKPIPRAGGLPIFIAVLIGVLLIIPLDKAYISILFASLIVVLIGLLDDKFDLSPYFRFAMNILCAVVVVFSGINIPFITNPFGGILHFEYIQLHMNNLHILIPISHILAIVWITWIMNMLNWSKGIDGQMPGIAAVSAIVIGVASLRFPILESANVHVAQMSFLVAGAALGFLVFNFHPAKIFPGYSATILGFLIGILSILSGVKLATAILVMGIPMTDALFTIMRRILAKKSPFWHDKGHLHHLLLDLGFSQRYIAIFYWIMSIFLGFLSLSLSSRGKLFAIILVIVIASAFIFSLRVLMRLRRQSDAIISERQNQSLPASSIVKTIKSELSVKQQNRETKKESNVTITK